MGFSPRRRVLALASLTLLIAATPAYGAGPSAPRTESCRLFGHKAKVESDPFGTDLAYLHIRQRVCTDGNRVTRVGRLESFAEITYSGSSSNWQWEGFTRKPFSRFKAVGAEVQGSRIIYAAGQFSARFHTYTSSAQVWVRMRVFGDGRAVRLQLDD